MKIRKKLIWQLYPSYLLITLLAIFAVIIFTAGILRTFYLENTRSSLEEKAVLLGEVFNQEDLAQPERVDILAKRIGKEINSRITIIRLDGLVLGDSREMPARMDNHGDRPEIHAAINDGIGMSMRYSYTLKKEMMYVATPLKKGGKTVAVMRVARAIPAISQTLKNEYMRITLAGLIAAILAGLASFIISHRINRRLQDLKNGVENFAKGNLEYRLPDVGSEEIATLADTMNKMAAQLNDRFHTIVEQRNELEAILTNMIEAVIVLNPQGNIIRFNRAALSMFNLVPEDVLGRDIFEVIRNADLHNFVQETFSAESSLEGEIVLHDDGDRFFQSYGSFIRDSEGNKLYLLIVLNDVTRLKRLETVRRDFVANVSHELKTPITSIKGFVETLHDGAIDDPEKTREFLSIVARHSDRLNAIIEDLLSLSRIEQDAEKDEIEREFTLLKPVVKSAFMICRKKAIDKGIELVIDCPDDLGVKANSALLEQALVNLIDNAVKYSDENSSVTVQCKKNGAGINVRVIDSGCGIPREDQPRIFERFYRVDKARSRKLGGTGLGLAIVKHIIQAHRGQVTVESEAGKGSTFTIFLPN